MLKVHERGRPKTPGVWCWGGSDRQDLPGGSGSSAAARPCGAETRSPPPPRALRCRRGPCPRLPHRHTRALSPRGCGCGCPRTGTSRGRRGGAGRTCAGRAARGGSATWRQTRGSGGGRDLSPGAAARRPRTPGGGGTGGIRSGGIRSGGSPAAEPAPPPACSAAVGARRCHRGGLLSLLNARRTFAVGWDLGRL